MLIGKLRYNFDNNRYALWDGDDCIHPGFHCGEPLDVLMGDTWVGTRFETDMSGEWYLVGMPDMSINGMTARI